MAETAATALPWHQAPAKVSCESDNALAREGPSKHIQPSHTVAAAQQQPHEKGTAPLTIPAQRAAGVQRGVRCLVGQDLLECKVSTRGAHKVWVGTACARRVWASPEALRP